MGNKTNTPEKTNIPERCLNCRWFSPRKWCIIGSFSLGSLDRQVPLLRDVRNDKERRKKAIMTVLTQQSALEFATDCKVSNTDRATPITYKEYCITRYAKDDPSLAVAYQQMSNEELTERFIDYCAHPQSMGNGQTTLYGIMWWELSRSFPQARFITPTDRKVYKVVPMWLDTVRTSGGTH